ncbi:hypothetical protein K438DRAFT_1775212 [Mycena galopus ATCC 62051]|nr:hypothetical protein K438DRAFT_1775212 [Mycena galopus ATCC 62051]
MIDYALLVKCTQRLCPYLISMIKDESVLVNSDIWSTFLESIDYKIFEFGAADSVLGYTHALFARRAGYYGPKGQFVLNSTINRLQDFVSFILVPFTATLLIAEDLDLDLEDAAKIRSASNEYGDVLQPDNGDDDIIKRLHEDNIEAMKDCFEGPTHAEVDEDNNKQKSVKATGLSLKDFKFEDEKPDKGAPALVSSTTIRSLCRFLCRKSHKKFKAKAALTVDDFGEPDPVAKKTAKKTKEKKTTAPKHGKKNTVQSSYGTRAKSKALRS